ncbi:MAG TPA: site-2 protease family protein [Anaerolineales bacterium]|nr:site-2 protease family protein [Anaerolineales bacterium]
MNETIQEHDSITPLVSRYFEIQQIVPGGGRFPFVMRYSGRLTTDSQNAHAKLSTDLEPHKLIPIFLDDGEQQVIQVVASPSKQRPSNPYINLIFFLLTLISMLIAGVLYGYEGPEPQGLGGLAGLLLGNLSIGIPFAASLLAILLAHEFGHYLAARFHKTAVTLPYFLPFPLSPFGTLGAFIQLKEPPRNKRVLFDIGIAGPLAGLVVAIPILLLGLSLSEVNQLPIFLRPGEAYSLEGNSILYLLAKYLVHGLLLPAPVTFAGLSPLGYWLSFFFTGQPFPLGATDVILHPIAWAGWAGLLVTALNLIPAGQLDGGHVLYSLLGRSVRLVLPFVLAGLAVLGFFWSGWWLWVFLILLMGGSHAQPLDQITKLDRRRMALAIFGIILFILVFTPIPLQIIQGPFGG